MHSFFSSLNFSPILHTVVFFTSFSTRYGGKTEESVRSKWHEIKHTCVYSGQTDSAVLATLSKVAAGGRGGLILSKCEMSRGAIWWYGSRICNLSVDVVSNNIALEKYDIYSRTRSNSSEFAGVKSAGGKPAGRSAEWSRLAHGPPWICEEERQEGKRLELENIPLAKVC